MPSSQTDQNREIRGFTLVELLVVIGVITVLVAVVLHAASALKDTAERGREMSAARTLAQAWISYATDNRGAVRPGYAEGFEAQDEFGNPIETESVPVAAKRWPWRLAGYLGTDIASFYSGEQRFRLSELSGQEYSETLYEVSAFPSFGLNSIFVGGDENYGGFSEIFTDTFGQFYVERLSTVRHPDDLIVFASAYSQEAQPGSSNAELREGYFRVLPPAWTQAFWADEVDPEDPASSGYVSSRHDAGVITVSVDGRVQSTPLEALRDMRRWSDSANAADWVLQPR